MTNLSGWRSAAVALPLVLGSCATGAGDDAGRELTVLAAASLTGTFTELAAAFEDGHPGVTVRLAFDSSATLAGQAVEGAPADVLATADLRTMQDAVDGGAVSGSPATFATNVMTLVVPAGNPAGISAFTDLDDPEVDFVACVETAPCGNAAAMLLASAAVDHAPASLEVDVKAVLQRVVAGEADAGVVYLTDAIAAGTDVESIDIPGADSQGQEYPIAILEQARDADLAQEFIDLVLSASGRDVFSAAGFGAP